VELTTILSGFGGFVFAAGSVEDIWGDWRQSPVGAEGLVGKTGRVLPPKGDDEAGWVMIEGERWKATARFPLSPGSTVQVEEVQGLQVVVSESTAPASRFARAARPRWQWLPGLALWSVAIAVALLGGGAIQGALVAGPLVVLVCFALVFGLAGDVF